VGEREREREKERERERASLPIIHSFIWFDVDGEARYRLLHIHSYEEDGKKVYCVPPPEGEEEETISLLGDDEMAGGGKSYRC
jgi:hypothetical protein